MLRSQVFDGADRASIGNPPPFMDGEENGLKEEDEVEGSSSGGSGGSARKKRRSLPDYADMDGKTYLVAFWL